MIVTECIKKNILSDFLRQNRAEAISMSIFEYDEELLKKTVHLVKHPSCHSLMTEGVFFYSALFIAAMKSFWSVKISFV